MLLKKIIPKNPDFKSKIKFMGPEIGGLLLGDVEIFVLFMYSPDKFNFTGGDTGQSLLMCGENPKKITFTTNPKTGADEVKMKNSNYTVTIGLAMENITKQIPVVRKNEINQTKGFHYPYIKAEALWPSILRSEYANMKTIIGKQKSTEKDSLRNLSVKDVALLSKPVRDEVFPGFFESIYLSMRHGRENEIKNFHFDGGLRNISKNSNQGKNQFNKERPIPIPSFWEFDNKNNITTNLSDELENLKFIFYLLESGIKKEKIKQEIDEYLLKGVPYILSFIEKNKSSVLNVCDSTSMYLEELKDEIFLNSSDSFIFILFCEILDLKTKNKDELENVIKENLLQALSKERDEYFEYFKNLKIWFERNKTNQKNSL